MQHESGDDYVRRLATFIRTNAPALAESGFTRRRRSARPESSSFAWFAQSPPNPLILNIDTHHLFYVLMRLEALGLDIGSLDVHIESPARPMSYPDIFPDQKNADTLSLASLRSSLSVVSAFSLGGSWWTRYDPPGIDAELKFIYSSFTKLPALAISAPGQRVITELIHDSPGQNAVPLDAFKNLQRLECENIDPRSLLGWDRLAESLRSLKVKNSGLQDISVVFIGAVLDDQARRQGSTSRKRRRNIPKTQAFHSSSLPDILDEDAREVNDSGTSSPPPPSQLTSLKWAFLKHLYLPDNGLTLFPSELTPYLTSLTHLDLSSNLLVSVPSALGEFYNLLSLNLADNLIDSVLGIYQNLGQVLSLNLSHNRLESLCGLERLLALERVDLRHNLLEESLEIGRLSTLPNISEIWVEGNPFVEIEPGYRVACFEYFWKEGKTISLDGTRPGLYEKRSFSAQEQTSSTGRPSTSSAPVVAVERHQTAGVPSQSPQPEEMSSSPSPHLPFPISTGVSRQRRKRLKRIVDLDGNQSDRSSRSGSHSRLRSGEFRMEQDTTNVPRLEEQINPSTSIPSTDFGTLPPSNPMPSNPSSSFDTGLADAHIISQRTRHSRHQTDVIHSPSFLPSSDGLNPAEVDYLPFSRPNRRMGSATVSSRSELRRNRISASVFEPHTPVVGAENTNTADDNTEAYRKRIELLKKDMGDSWLKVYNQSQRSQS